MGVCLLFLVFNALYYTVISLVQHFAGSGTGTLNGSTATITTTASIATIDNMSLAQLESLSFSNSTKCTSFLSPSWWDTAIRASGETTLMMVPNTAYGLVQSYSGWSAYFGVNASYVAPNEFALDFMKSLAVEVMATHDITKAAAVVENYTVHAAAFSATAADYVSFGGLSALRVGIDTGNLTQAVAQTFPAQVYQLFVMSQDCSYSEQQRATLFGTAMSMSLLVLATAGKDGFTPKFEGLLTKLGLRDAWSGMKAYVKEIMDASPEAAYQTMMVLSAMAQKFPTNQFPDLPSFTSSRIANMVHVLKDKAFSADEISQQVAALGKAVDESDDEGHVADVADVADATSYGVEGFIRAKIDQNLQPALFSTAPHNIRAAFMALILPDFKVGDATALRVTVHKLWMKLPSFHEYEGGEYVRFELPKGEVQSGDEVGLSFEVLPVEDFARSIPPIPLINSAHLPWLTDEASLTNFKVVDGVLQFDALQSNPWWSGEKLTIQGQVVAYPEVSTSGGIYAEFAIKDYAGRARDLRLRFDGFSFEGADLQLVMGVNSNPISLVSFDGYRLQFVYRSDNRIATMYLEPPSEAVYSQSAMHPYSGSNLDLVQGKYTNAWQIDSVVLPRDLEKSMLEVGSTYVLGRLGSENAYVVCDKQLGLKNVIIEEPSQGGRDLYTLDNTVAIQARFLKNLGANPENTIQTNLFDLADKLQQDYKYQKPYMQDGYAILSYLDTDGTVKIIILEVPKW